MFVEYTADDTGYYRFVEWDRPHEAYYFTNGQYVKLNWNADKGIPKYYYEDGTELKLNPGNTFITVFDYSMPEEVVIE